MDLREQVLAAPADSLIGRLLYSAQADAVELTGYRRREDANAPEARREEFPQFKAAMEMARLRSELERVTNLLYTWAADHSGERTAEIDAALHCAREAIAKSRT